MNFEILLLFFCFLVTFRMHINYQFPASCVATISSGVCCPNNCNAASGRGTCTTITNQANSQWNNALEKNKSLLTLQYFKVILKLMFTNFKSN